MKNKLLLVILGLFVCSLSFADEDHYINVFVGDRAAGMGGAYTALADGPEGVYYNPAGLAFSSSQYFSLSANAIQFKMKYYQDVYQKSDNTSWNYMRYSLSFIPNFFGFIQKAKHFTWAITVACPDSEFYDQRDNAEIYSQTINQTLNTNFNYSNQIYEAGPSIAFLPNKYFAIGMSAFFRYRDIKKIQQDTRTFKQDLTIGDNLWKGSADYFQIDSTYQNDRILGLNFQVGIQVMPIDKISIGYSISTPFDMVDFRSTQSESYYSMLDASNMSVVNLPGIGYQYGNTVKSNENKTYHLAEHGLFRPLYIKQALGFCFFINKSILLTLDGYLYIPIQNMDKDFNIVSYQWNKDTLRYDQYLGGANKLNTIGNVAMGFECYITPNFPLRFGLFTNFTNAQEIKDAKSTGDDWLHLFGGSFSFGFSTSDMSVNLGAVVQGGGGKAIIVSGAEPVTLIGVTANLFLSGGYQF